MMVESPGCPNDPGVAYIRFESNIKGTNKWSEWQFAQNLPWVHIQLSHLDEQHLFGQGVFDQALTKSMISVPNLKSIEIAMYHRQGDMDLTKSVNALFEAPVNSFGLKFIRPPSMAYDGGENKWFKDNSCNAIVHDKSNVKIGYSWWVIDSLPCDSVYQMIYAPGIGGQECLVIKTR